MSNESRSRAYLCPECDFRLCAPCVHRRDPRAPRRHPASDPGAIVSAPGAREGLWDQPATAGLWDDPTEGMQDLEPLLPSERVWEDPTEKLEDVSTAEVRVVIRLNLFSPLKVPGKQSSIFLV